MVVTLFKNKNLEGESFAITQDCPDLKNTAVKYSTSSIKISSMVDKALFFKKKNYKGKAMFRKTKQEILKASSKKSGGKSGFGNTISSVRKSAFTVKLFVNVITEDNGAFVNLRASDDVIENYYGIDFVESYVKGIIKEANKVWNRNLLELELDEIVIRRSAKYHVLPSLKSAKLLIAKKWKKTRHINVYIVKELFGGRKHGSARQPTWGRGLFLRAI